jgi:hypothetical protein
MVHGGTKCVQSGGVPQRARGEPEATPRAAKRLGMCPGQNETDSLHTDIRVSRSRASLLVASSDERESLRVFASRHDQRHDARRDQGRGPYQVEIDPRLAQQSHTEFLEDRERDYDTYGEITRAVKDGGAHR